MNHNCPCPKNGCVKTAHYLERHHSTAWSGHKCPHCGNWITKRGSKECPCVDKFCPCKGMKMHKHEAKTEACPCIKANCDCLSAEWKKENHRHYAH